MTAPRLRKRNCFVAARQLTLAAMIAVLSAAGPFAQTGRAQQPGVKATADPTVRSTSSAAATVSEKSPPDPNQPEASNLETAIARITVSGRVLQIGEGSSSRLKPIVRLAPGAPPILAFRYLDGQARHRFGDLDLVMDDAGH
jgi:hypothetical protein